MLEFDFSDDGRMDGIQIFRQGVSKPIEILVHLRKADDIQALADQVNALREENARLKRDIYSWTITGNRYLVALDELRELQRLCKEYHIDFPFQSLR